MDQAQPIPLRALGDLFPPDGNDPAGTPAPQASARDVDQAAALRPMAGQQQPLRLADDSPPAGPKPPIRRWREHRPWLQSAKPIAMQAVFLGNLPGFAGPWLNQYAYRLASEQQRPILILRFDPQQVELVAVGDAAGVALLSEHFGRLCEQTRSDRQAVLADLLRDDALLAGCLLHVPAGAPHGMKLARQVRTWTLLCGQDEPAAVVAAQWLEHLMAGAFEDTAELRSVRVGVMVMGAQPGCEQQVIQHLEQAAAGRLAEPIASLGTQKRMLPVHVETLGRIEADSRQQVRLLEGLTTPKPSPVPLEEAAAVEVSKPAGQPGQARESAAGPDLVALAGEHLGVQGLEVLAINCPRQEKAVLAVDQSGRLHLLWQHAGSPDDLRAALLGLFEARQWAAQHAAILQQLGAHLDPQADPVLHLFSDHAREAARLIPAVEQWVRLYLLAPVQAADQTAWYCSPLN